MPHPAAGQAARAEAAMAVTELFRAHHLELVRIALVMVGDVGVAEDVVQDAFEQLHRRWRRLRAETSGLAYARSSVLNGCRSVHRRRVVARRYARQLPSVPGAGPGGAAPDSAEQSADRSVLLAALHQLPRRQREVVVLRYYADLEVAEVARTLGISPSAVRSTATRGLAALAEVLKED